MDKFAFFVYLKLKFNWQRVQLKQHKIESAIYWML